MNIATRMILYDFCYAAGDFFIKTFNPCKIHKFQNGEICCIAPIIGGGTCCYGCRYLDYDKGCTVKCLMCKLHLCSGVVYKAKINKQIRRRLLLIQQVSWSLSILDMRNPKSFTRKRLLKEEKRNA